MRLPGTIMLPCRDQPWTEAGSAELPCIRDRHPIGHLRELFLSRGPDQSSAIGQILSSLPHAPCRYLCTSSMRTTNTKRNGEASPTIHVGQLSQNEEHLMDVSLFKTLLNK